MNKYLLGRKPGEDKITEFVTVKEADFEAEEYCFVSGQSLSEAKKNFDATFERLQKQGKIRGPFQPLPPSNLTL